MTQAVFDRPEGDDSATRVTWNLAQAQTGETIQLVKFADRSIQAAGTFGGATVEIQGSNDGTNWVTLNKFQGTPATFTTAGVAQILENTLLLRPFINGGDGTTALAVTLLARQGTSIIRK